jgi:hypothetical protein
MMNKTTGNVLKRQLSQKNLKTSEEVKIVRR